MNQPITIYKQIHPNQCTKIADLGYRSLINIRPNAETDDQPDSKALQNAAENANLNYVYLPFDCDRLSRQTIERFAQHYRTLPKPIMLFCGTGSRAKLLYQSALIQNLL